MNTQDDHEYTTDLPEEIENEEMASEPLSPSDLLGVALSETPGKELMPYLTTVLYLKEHKKFSYRGIAKWLKEKGNIETSHTTVSRLYQYVTEHPHYSEELREAREELDEILIEQNINPDPDQL
jgi:hypothetical protein